MDIQSLISSHPKNRFSPEGDNGLCAYMVVDNFIVYVHRDNLHLCLGKPLEQIHPLIDHVFGIPYNHSTEH